MKNEEKQSIIEAAYLCGFEPTENGNEFDEAVIFLEKEQYN